MADTPIKLFDAQTKLPLEVLPQDANDALKTGQVLAENKKLYDVVGPDNSYYQIPGSKLAEALQDGLALETGAQQTSRIYGDSELRAGAEGVLRGLTFGVSDVVQPLIGGGTAEEIAGRKEANPGYAVGGEFGGVVAPLVLSGGLGVAGLGVRGAAKVGLAAEAAVAKQGIKALAKAGIKNSLARTLVEKGLAKAAGSATEASLYGIGNIISESALGKADFNAENVLASAKDFAIFGGLAGGGLGLAGAGLSKAGSSIADSAIGKRVKNKLDDFASPVTGVDRTLDQSASRSVKFEKLNGEVKNDLPQYFKDEIGVKTFDSVDNIVEKNEKNLEKVGQDISNVLKETNEAQKTLGAGVTVGEYKKALNEGIDDLFGKDGGLAKMAANSSELKFLEKERKALLKRANIYGDDSAIISIENLHNLRKEFDRKINYLADTDATSKARLNYAARSELRGLIDESIARVEKSAPELAGNLEALKKANKSYYLGSLIRDDLAKAAAKEGNKGILSTRDILLGGVGSLFAGPAGAALGAVSQLQKSQVLNNLRILGQIERANQNVQKVISKSVNEFFKPGIPIGLKAVYTLSDSDIAKDDKMKSPKNTQAAYNNASKNLSRVTSDYNAALENINRRTAFMYKAAPETASQVDALAFTAMQFLQSKLPTDKASKGMIQQLKQVQRVSTLQLAKFQRYVEAVEKPLEVVKSLSQGRINREGVETLKTVYPNIFGMLQNKVMDEVTKSPESISYQKRLQLGTLLNIPTDTSLIPENILALQQNINETVGSDEQNSAVEPTTGGIKNIDKATRLDVDGSSELD